MIEHLTLPDLFAGADKLLNDRLDGLAIQFRDDEIEFYQQYTATRVIVDKPGGHKLNGNVVPTPTPVPRPA